MSTPLFDMPEPRIADTSLDSYARILPTLLEREVLTFLRVCDYVALTGYDDVTGMELADWAGVSVLALRPRLTELVDKGWLVKGPARKSRAKGEARAHGVYPAVPREAIERVR